MRSIYNRLLVPQLSVLVLGTALAWWLATDLVADALHARLEQQLTRAVTLFSDRRLPASEGLLRRLGNLLDARFALVPRCTEDPAEPPSEPIFRNAREVLCNVSRDKDPVSERLQVDGDPYLALLAPAPAEKAGPQAGRVVLAVTSLAEIQGASQRIALQLGAVAACGLIILAWVSHLIARGITRPISELAALASRLARDQEQPRAQVHGPQEIRTLARTFNAMADRLLDYESEIAEKNRLAALGELSARLAHEIRNPLTAIKLNVQLLAEANPDAGERRRMARVSDEIRRLELVVESALSLARTTACRPREQHIGPVVEEVTALLSPHLAHRGIELECTLAQLDPLYLDADRIKQLLLNLLQNASDALPDGGRVRVSVRAARDGGAELVVEDSGPGVEEALRDSLFRRSVSSKPGGLGVGLLVGREIVDQHGGNIRVERSEELGGASFRVELPPVPAANPRIEPAGHHES